MTAETVEWGAAPAAESSEVRAWTSRVVALLATLLAVGLGYVAFEQWQGQQRSAAALADSKSKLDTLTAERSRAAALATEQRTKLESQEQKLKQDDAELGELKVKLGAAEARLRELEAQSEALNAHLTEFRALTQQFKRMIDSGKLQISYRRGRMIVELPAAVLFASGSAELSSEGRQALQEIAKILRKVPGKRFLVGGHTDDVPIAKPGSGYTSNWALSAARAVTVTESLIDSGLRANQLVAAGFGEHDPIATNGNERGRQKNRRIEIVLEPKLAEVAGTSTAKSEADSRPVVDH